MGKKKTAKLIHLEGSFTEIGSMAYKLNVMAADKGTNLKNFIEQHLKQLVTDDNDK